MPFMILQAFSADSEESNRTVPQPLDFPFSILISANMTWPVKENITEVLVVLLYGLEIPYSQWNSNLARNSINDKNN